MRDGRANPIRHLARRRGPELLEDGDNGLPGLMRALLNRLLTQLEQLDQQVAALEREIVLWHRQNAHSSTEGRIYGCNLHLLRQNERDCLANRGASIYGSWFVAARSRVRKSDPQSCRRSRQYLSLDSGCRLALGDAQVVRRL